MNKDVSSSFGTASKVRSSFQNFSQAPPSILYQSPSPGVQDCFKGKKEESDNKTRLAVHM